MKISYNWLKDYLNTDLSPEQAAEILTDIGLEVESIEPYEKISGGLQGIVIGEVLSAEKHPDADRLKITTVNVGGDAPLQIVCGASNVAQGQKVVVATVGATLYPTQGEPFQIKKSKIRGAESQGMICAEDEIGLGASHDGIMVLDSEAKIGSPASEYFNIKGDIVFEIGLTPNRADAASHIGVARDISVALKLRNNSKEKINIPSTEDFLIKGNTLEIAVEVQNKEACPRYCGITVSGVNVGPSPEWLSEKLVSIGLKPINNIVDITNFILHEIGQPLHAFDADKISENKIIVKNAQEGEKFITLDDTERTLKSNNLMICDSEKSLGIAGVFGGKHSGITESTKNIFIESAYFNPVSVRKTSKDHGLKTDASFRFERGANPDITLYALKRAAILMEELAGGKISSQIVDIYPEPIKPFNVELSYHNCDRLIGKTIERETIKQILEALEIKITIESPEGLTLEVPAFKVDVTREADVIEEILRIYGYNNIEMPSQIRASLNISPKPDKEKIRNRAADILCGAGFTEMMNNSLTKAAYSDLSSMFKAEENVMILNPLSTDLNCMRRSLLFGGLEALAFNLNHKNSDIKFFEFGRIYFKNAANNYKELHKLALFVTGTKNKESIFSEDKKTDIFFLKGALNALFEKLGIEAKESVSDLPDFFSSGITYTSRKRTLAQIGTVSKKILKTFDINKDVFYAELDWDFIIELSGNARTEFKDIPKFPAVRRDLALVLDKKVKFSEIQELAYQTERNLLKEVNIFDVYEGDKIKEGKKSYALSFILQDTEKTLTDEQIEKIMSRLLKTFEEKIGAELR
jgi:phenylalanyl-tRNA synthetase beta chain